MAETKWEILEIGEGTTINENGGKLNINMVAPIWEHVYLKSNQFPCEARKVYKIKIDADKGKSDFRTLIQFYGESGRSMDKYRLYLETEDTFTVPADINRFDITAVICTRENAEVTLGEISYEYVEDYKPQNVRLCSISDAMISWTAKRETQHDLMMEYVKLIDKVVEKEHPDLIVLTEHFHNMCDPALKLNEKFVGYDNEVVTLIAEKAKEHGVYISGSFHILENGCRYNRAILFDRKGEIIAEYDKTHLTIMEYEMGVVPGDKIVTVDTEIGRLGFVICWDIWFPGLLELYYKAGVDILINPTRGDGRPQANAASYTSGCYVVSSAYQEMNRIQDKRGKSIDECGRKGYAVATVDIKEPAWVPHLSVGGYCGEGRNIYRKERRPDLYGPLSEVE